MVESVVNKGIELAIIIRNDYHEQGIHFLTQDDYSQQLAYMSHPVGKKIEAHVHNSVKRSIHITQEVLVIKKGKLRVDFYDNTQIYLESRILREGDIILLVSGGHGFEVLADVEMVEIKQGPYAGDADKTRFSGVKERELRIIE